MSQIIRVRNDAKHTLGWQARVTVPHHPRLYVSRFFSDRKHGGERQAYELATAALPGLKRKARQRAQGGLA